MEIGKINIDFEIIPTYNPQKLWIADSSLWLGAENLASTICIISPGSKKAVNIAFQKHKINIFHSLNLGLSCLIECEEQKYANLPDGIWTISVKSGYTGVDKKRYYLKTDVIRIKLDEIYIKAGLEYDKNSKRIREDLMDIEFLLRTAEAFARRGDFVKANRDYTVASELIDKYINCKNCI